MCIKIQNSTELTAHMTKPGNRVSMNFSCSIGIIHMLIKDKFNWKLKTIFR